MKNPHGALPTRVIGRSNFAENLGELWRYRHLCFYLANADLESRFRRSSLGILWAMVHPLAFAMLYAVMLASLFQQDFRAFSIYVFSGIVLWDAISAFINAGANSLINASGYVKQSAIPLLIFPIRTCLTIMSILALSFLSFSIYTFAVSGLFGHSIYFGVLWVWAIPVALLLFVVGIPIATITALLNVKFRDTQQILVIATQALWFSSPIFIAREVFETPHLRYWEMVNPVVAVTDLFRDPVIHGIMPSLNDWIVIGIWSLALWVIAGTMLVLFGRRIVFYL